MIKVGYDSNIGIKRKRNEDAYYIMDNYNIYMVADGVGGNNSGEVASKSSLEFISKILDEYPIDSIHGDKNIKDFFIKTIIKANEYILEKGVIADKNQGMATTLVLAYINLDKCYIFNVGDSRAYLFRDKILKQITEDHSFVNTLIKTGAITKEEGRNHPKKNIITRAIGADSNIQVDVFTLDLQVGDKLLLSTDGLHGEIEESKLEELIAKEQDMQKLCNNLVNMANLYGGNDNITVICIHYEGEMNEY